MTKRILIMGLPGSGKSTLSRALLNKLKHNDLKAEHLDVDFIRPEFKKCLNLEDYIRESLRMKKLSNIPNLDYVIADFVAPLVEMRKIYQADFTVWVDTVEMSPYPDDIYTSIFIKPETYDLRVTEQDAEKWSSIIFSELMK